MSNERLRIEEICSKASSNLAQKQLGENRGCYPVFGASGFIQNIDSFHQEHPYIGIVKDGSGVGRVNIYPAKSSLLGTMQYIIPKPHCDLVFLAYALKSLDLSSFANGAAIPHIYFKDYGKCVIPVPPLAEQKRIVEELDLLSGIIEKQKQQLKELDTLAQSIFYDMFGDPVTNEKGWEKEKIENVGQIISGSTPSTRDESNWDGDINWVIPAELGEEMYIGETQRKITEKAASKLTLMPIGTVLLSSRAPIGKLAITTELMCCNQGFKNIICGPRLNNVFLFYLLLLSLNEIQALGRGATFKEVSKKELASYKIILPPLSLQNLFASKIEAIEKQKETITKSIEEIKKLFDYTMDKHFG